MSKKVKSNKNETEKATQSNKAQFDEAGEEAFVKYWEKANSKSVKMSTVSKVILIISISVFIGSGTFLLYKYIGEPILEQMELAAYKDNFDGADTPTADDGVWSDSEEEDEEEERLSNGMLAAFESLVEMNSDVVGWISIPNTLIDYPVVQAENNTYYLNHNINKESNSSGCPFVDYRNLIGQGELSKCTIIYGHHRKNGTMFASLTNYNDIDFYKENPVLRFDTIYDRGEWVIFANLRTSTTTASGEIFNYMRTSFDSDEDFLEFVEDLRERSLIDTPVNINADDEILLLSTCSYEKSGWRMIIAARRVRDGETVIDVSSATEAENPVMP